MTCQPKAKLHVSDYGTVITLTIVAEDVNGDTQIVDISSATELLILWTKPISGDVVSTVASFLTDGTDGKITYTIEEDFLDEVGDWRYRAEVTTGSSKHQSSECVERVYSKWTVT